MYYYLNPLLLGKQPDYVILQFSNNDAISMISDVVLKELVLFKVPIESTLPSCIVKIADLTIYLIVF